MSAVWHAAFAATGWGAAPLAFAGPRSLLARWQHLAPVAMLRRNARLLLDALDGKRRPAAGGPDQPDDEARESPWNDPALWMLMMH